MIGVAFISTACNLATEYVPDPRLTKQTGAVIHVADRHVRGWSGTTELDVYDFNAGCPDIGTRLKSRGYEGSIPLNVGRDPQVIIPTGQTIVLRLAWSRISPFSNESCITGVKFKPEADSEYLVVYGSPASGGNRCGVGLLELVDGPKGNEAQRVEDAVPLDIKRGFSGPYSDRLCSERP
ncbi:MAG TPA: hypothetical protein VLC06_02405 [Polyangia bacterium]|nr:hypothetical protein [Polyangia bacterium]